LKGSKYQNTAFLELNKGYKYNTFTNGMINEITRFLTVFYIYNFMENKHFYVNLFINTKTYYEF